MDKNELMQKTVEMLAEEFEIEPSVITPEAKLMETLRLDSLDLVDVVVLIEKNFGVTLIAQDFRGIVTVDDFINMISNKINELR